MSLLTRTTTYLQSQAQSAVISILASGPIPQHVAFVMDGNRRYARIHQKEIREGHSDGFLALRRMLEICLKLGVRYVTAYAFAIENFKRSAEEVDALMQLAEEKLLEICQHGQLLDEYGIRLNVLGKTELLPPAVQAAVKKAEDMTRHNERAVLNLCMPYASRHEITLAVQSVVRDVLASGADAKPDITEADIEANLMISKVGSLPLDILVRTSGVKRLSDFMLWQCCEDTQLHLASAYWPEFGLWDFVPIILDYQRKVWARSSPASPRSQSIRTAI